MKKLFLLLLLAASICCAQNPNNNPAGANNTWVVVGNPAQQFSPTQKGTIQDAVNFAGPGGVVWIPPSYAGTESLLSIINPNNVLMIDLRGGTFQTYPPLPSGGGSTATPTASAVVSQGIDYGTCQHLQPCQPQIVTISSNGTLPFTVTGVTFTGPFSVLTNPCLNQQLIPGNSCSLLVIPTPVGSGAVENGSVTFTTTAPVVPLNPLSASLKVRSTPLPSFLLTISGFGTGGGTIADGGVLNCHLVNGVPDSTSICQLNYPTGTLVTLTPTADPGSTFASFAGAGCTTSCTITISAAATVSATFNLAPVVNTLSISGVGQGTGLVTSDVNDVLTGTPLSCTSTAGVLTGKCQGSFNQGTVVTLTEAPSLSGVGSCAGGNCTFTTWGGANACTTASTCAVTVTANATVTATFATPAAGTWALVQHPSKTNCVAGTSCAITLTQNTGSGNLLVAIAHQGNFSSVIASMTSGCTGAWTVSSTNAWHTSKTDVAYCLSSASGAATITFNFSNSNTPTELKILEYSNASGASFDTSGTSVPGVCVSCLGIPLTLTGNNDVIVQWIDNVNAVTVTAVSSPYTNPADFPGLSIGAEAGSINTSSGVAPTWTQSGASGPTIGAIAFQSAGTTSAFTFNIIGGGSGSGTVTASGINCTITAGVTSGTCSTTVSANGTITLNSIPASGSTFVNYNGAGCATSPTCVSSAITTNTVVTVNFALSGPLNYYVRTDGSDSNNGLANTAGGAWRTITHAAAALTLGASGTTVNVAAGTYNECVLTNQTGTATQRIRYISTTPLGAVVKCDGSSNPSGQLSVWSNGTGSNARTADYVDITGFEITPTTPTNRCFGIVSFGAFARITNNYVHDILGQSGVSPAICAGGGGAGIDLFNNGNPPTVAHDSVVDSNVIDNIGTGVGGLGTSGPNMHGVYIASPRQTVTNNLITRSSGWAVQMFHDTCQDLIAGNTFVHNYNGGILVSASDTNSSGSASTCAASGSPFVNGNTSVIDNIVANNGGNESGIEERYGNTNNTNVYRNNYLWGNTPQAFNLSLGARTVTGNTCAVAETNCQTVNTGLTNAGVFVAYGTGIGTGSNTNNFQQTGASPTINGGITGPCAASPGITPCVPSLDYLGQHTRPQRASYDPGFLELP